MRRRLQNLPPRTRVARPGDSSVLPLFCAQTARSAAQLSRASELGDSRSLKTTNLGSLIVSLLLVLAFGPQTALAQKLVGSTTHTGPPEIEIGDATSFPSETQVLVPVYVSSADSVRVWQTSVDYDPTVLSLVGVEFAGTASEPLNAVATLSPASAPFFGVRVQYPTQTPLPAGSRVLAAYLRFNINWNPGPGASTINTTIEPGALEPFSTTVENASGTVVPSTSGSTVTLFSGPTLRIDRVASSAYQALALGIPIELVIRGWTPGPSSSYQIGLDYVDLFLTQTEDEISPIVDALTGATLNVAPPRPNADLWTITIVAPPGQSFPPLDGEIVAIVKLAPSAFWFGSAPLTFSASETLIDGSNMVNLVEGTVSLAPDFVRGDASLDGNLSVGDALLILDYVITDPAVDCPSALDTNDDGTVNIADVITALSHLFAGGPPLPAPFLTPGADPTPDSLDCGVQYVP